MSQPATAKAQTADALADVARPFLWLAALAFASGFCGYLALSPLLGL